MMNWHTHVHDLMSRDPVTVDLDASPSALRRLLEERSFHHLPVLDGGVLVGIVSLIDLARVSLEPWVHDRATDDATVDATFRVADLMTWEPETVRDHDPARLAADKLCAGNFHALPVLDAEDRLVGIITSTDLLRWLVRGA